MLFAFIKEKPPDIEKKLPVKSNAGYVRKFSLKGFFMFRKMPILLLAMIFLIIPVYLKQFIYSLSLFVKSLLIFILPILIFMLLFKTISQLSRTATKMIFLLLITLCCSNFLSTMISSQIGAIIYQFDLCIKMPTDQIALMPIWSFTLPKWVANDHAMFAGIFSGIFFSLF